MTIFSDTVDKAFAELKKLQKQDDNLGARLAAVRHTNASLSSSRGAEKILDEFLQNDEVTRRATRQRIADGVAEEADLELARAALCSRRKGAILKHADVKAAAVNVKADKLREELAKHNDQTRVLLEKLEAHEGARYVLAVPEVLPPGTISGPVTWRAPKSHGLHAEIARLESQAKGLVTAAKSRLKRDFIESPSLDGLLEAARDVERLAPHEHEIGAWFAEASERQPQSWANHNFHDYPDGPEGDVVYHLEWTEGGKIDAVASKPILIAVAAVKTPPAKKVA